jgi:hypothetical protein
MTRTTITTAILLALALALAIPILPQFIYINGWILQWIDGRSLLPLVGIVIGLLRGESQGMAAALAAACLCGFSHPPGQLGASIDGFVLSAFLAGWATRRIQLYGTITRWFLITVLLLVAHLTWWGVRLFWRETPPLLEFIDKNIAWPALILTALLGSYLYHRLSPKMRLWLYTDN